jgi:type IV pilus assembly protein PilB
MMMTNKLREQAFAGAPTQEIRRTALSQGMTALYNDGIRKVLNGTTTIEEVFRVAKRADS